ncbi:MAG: RidA family protein [Chthoniobacterales bacterium]
MPNHSIHTDQAPKPIGTYSQAIRAGNTIYLSGQVGFDPVTMEIVAGLENQLRQIFKNIGAVVSAAGATLDQIVKITVFLTDMNDFPKVNEVMAEFFLMPYPARSAVGVKELPKQAMVEVEGIVCLPLPVHGNGC